MDEFWPALADLAVVLCQAVAAVAVAVGPMAWQVLRDYPAARTVLLLAAVPLFLYWFYDGVRNWRRKCLWCRGRGAFHSKLSKDLDRPCSCCGGSGRHTTIRKRIVSRSRS